MIRLDRLRRCPSGDDGVAILMALAYIGIFTSLMLAMLAIVVGQVKPTAQARKDIGSLNAASSGLQTALGNLRTATDSNGDGNRGRLPCQAGTPTSFRKGSAIVSTVGANLGGTASNLPGNFRYQVSVAYFMDDPSDKDPVWLQAHALPCPLAQTPLYAYLQSYGYGSEVVTPTAQRGNRSQTGVYQLSVPQENIAGGRLRSFNRDMCLDAGSNPQIGTLLYFRTCAPLGTPQQLFEYRQDLTLFYGGVPALNLCIQGSASQQPQLQRCKGTGTGSTYAYAEGQQVQTWSFNDNGHFALAGDDGNVTGQCLQPAADAVGTQLSIYACTGSIDAFQAFDPDPAVGAGKAGGNRLGVVGAPTNQYVNFEQFGRCLDVKGQKISNNYMIAYPCKQAPDSSKLTWNQVWQFGVVSGNVGRMYTRTPSNYSDAKKKTDYCLEAPSSGNVINIKECGDPVPLKQRWTATGEVPGNPDISFHLISASRNQCMSLGARDAGTGSSTVILENCSKENRQRWNAPPPPPISGLNNVREGTSVQFG